MSESALSSTDCPKLSFHLCDFEDPESLFEDLKRTTQNLDRTKLVQSGSSKKNGHHWVDHSTDNNLNLVTGQHKDVVVVIRSCVAFFIRATCLVRRPGSPFVWFKHVFHFSRVCGFFGLPNSSVLKWIRKHIWIGPLCAMSSCPMLTEDEQQLIRFAKLKKVGNSRQETNGNPHWDSQHSTRRVSIDFGAAWDVFLFPRGHHQMKRASHWPHMWEELCVEMGRGNVKTTWCGVDWEFSKGLGPLCAWKIFRIFFAWSQSDITRCLWHIQFFERDLDRCHPQRQACTDGKTTGNKRCHRHVTGESIRWESNTHE